MIETAIQTRVGPREQLEDAALASIFHGADGMEAATLSVLDGVGGASGGEVASGLGTVHVHTFFAAGLGGLLAGGNGESADEQQLVRLMDEALHAANRAVIEQADRTAAGCDMATTAVCALIVKNALVVGWAGDSRAYRFHDGGLFRLTRDHSVVFDLLDRGQITLEESRHHPAAHVITRYLGQRQGFAPEVCVATMAPGDVGLLCTDGVTDVLSDEAIQQIVAGYGRNTLALNDLAVELVNRSLRAGTMDNATVLCCRRRIESAPTCPSAPRTVTGGYVVAVANLQHKMGESHETE